MSILSLPLAHLKAHFLLDGIKYQVDDFSISFRQFADFKGQPQNEVKGGQLSITIPQAADDNLYLWAKTSTLLKNGQIIFQTDLGITVLRIHFESGYCVKITREYNPQIGTHTNLVISPEIVTMNGTEFDNQWKKK